MYTDRSLSSCRMLRMLKWLRFDLGQVKTNWTVTCCRMLRTYTIIPLGIGRMLRMLKWLRFDLGQTMTDWTVTWCLILRMLTWLRCVDLGRMLRLVILTCSVLHRVVIRLHHLAV